MIPVTASVPSSLRPTESVVPVQAITEGLVPYGTWAGMPAVIIRLQGCPVACPWCDQPNLWLMPTHDDQVGEEELEQPGGANGWRWLNTTRLLALVESLQAHAHVLITGGEPCLWDLRDLTRALLNRGSTCQVETSGVAPLQIDPDCWLTLSPKHNQPGGMQVLPGAYRRANEIVLCVGGDEDGRWIDRAAKERSCCEVFICPRDDQPEARAACWRLARSRSCRISLPMVYPAPEVAA